VVCGPEWTAAGMPAKRNPRKSAKGTRGERKARRRSAVIHGDGASFPGSRGFKRRPRVLSR